MKQLTITSSFVILSLLMFSMCAKPPNDNKKAVTKTKILKTNKKNPTAGKLSKTKAVKIPALPHNNGKISELAYIRLAGVVGEKTSKAPFANKVVPLHKLLKVINKLGNLKTADTLFIYLAGLKASFASRWEIRKLLLKIKKEQKKKIIIYADSLDTKSYFLASVGNKVFLNPAGGWDVSGIALETLFYKDFLAFLGIKADFLHVGKYKGAAESITRTSMSPDLKVSLEALIDSLFNDMVSQISASRKIHKNKLKEMIDTAPLTPQVAFKNHLVDGIEPYSKIFLKYSKNLKVRKPKKKKKKKMSFMQLLSPTSLDNEVKTPHVALILLEGTINYGFDNPDDIFSKTNSINSASVLKILKKVKENKSVKAVVIRVNSPGGSALASEIIWWGIHNLNIKKPVIISMGTYAASGGYYISSAASKIVVSPFTLTGSIGVVGGKMVFEKTMTKLKIKSETIKRGKNASWISASTPFSPEERVAVLASMKNVYSLFKNRIKSGRPQLKNIESIAQGRVWSGSDAIKIGLADKIGGLLDAASLAKKSAKLKSDTPVIIYPRPKPWMLALSELFEQGQDMDEVLSRGVISTYAQILGINNNFDYKKLFDKEHVTLLVPVIISGF